MKKTQRTDAVRGVQKRIISFLSICLIISLATGGFLITNFMEKSMKAKTDEFYSQQHFKDFEMISSAGITPGELDIIGKVEGVADVEGVMLLSGTLQSGQDSYSVQLISLTDRISVPKLADGRMPQKDGEIVVGEDFISKCGLQVGQKVTLTSLGNYTTDPLYGKEYTIVGSVKHPEYLRSGTTWVVGLPLSGFNMEATNDSFTRAFIRADDVPGSGEVYDKYFNSVADVHERLQQLLPILSAGTTQRIQNQAQEQIKEQWDEVEQQLAEANRQLEEARTKADAEIANAENQLQQGRQELDEGYQKLIASEKMIEEYERQIQEAIRKTNDVNPLMKKAANSFVVNRLEKLLQLINAVRDAADEGVPEIIEQKRQQLLEYVTEDNVGLVFFLAELVIDFKTYDIIDMINTSEGLDRAAQIIEDALDFFAGNTEFFAEFTQEKIVETLDHMIVLVDNINNASEDKIEAAVDTFNNYAKTNLGHFVLAMIRYRTGVDVAALINQLPENVDAVCSALKGAMAQLKEDSEYLEQFTIEVIESKLQEYKDLVEEYAEAIRTGAVEKIEELRDRIDNILSNDANVVLVTEALRAFLNIDITGWIQKLREGTQLDQIISGMQKLLDYIKQYRDAVKNLPSWQQRIAKARQDLSEGWKKYYSGRQRLEENEALFDSKVGDARQQFSDAQEEILARKQEAEEKLDEYRSEVQKLKASWIVTDRMSNGGFVDISSNLRSNRSEGLAMGSLFMVIASLVSFSTLIIIVEEEKKLVGTSKAFGLFNNEILGKYLAFGVSAAVIGSAFGILLSYLGARMVLNSFDKVQMYIYGPMTTLINWKTALIVAAVAIMLCVAVVVFACTDLLRSPASILMKGETNGSLKKQQKAQQINEKAQGGKLYTRLIWRNILNEKARVAIGIAVVAGSCLMMGGGITIREAFNGMMAKQQNDVYLYDVRVILPDSITNEDKTAIEKQFKADNADYLSACLETHLYDDGTRISGLNVLCGDPQRIGSYVAVSDPKTKKPVLIPDNGILVQNRMMENYKYQKGETIDIYDNSLLLCQAPVAGQFNNYQGRLVICSPQAYRSIFGSEHKDNCYYVKLNGMDLTTLQQQLDGICEGLGYEEDSAFTSRFATVASLFNILTIGMTVIAVIISFMILTNLANILMNRKHRELIVMRINGYSISQTIGYLARETVITTIAGLILGVILGAILLPIGVKSIEQPDVQFVRDFCPKAWIIAVALEALFAAVIYTLVFRKVRKLNFRDITG